MTDNIATEQTEEVPSWVHQVQLLTEEIATDTSATQAKVDEKRAVLLSVYNKGDGLSMAEIGRLIGVSRERVSTMLGRPTKKQLRARAITTTDTTEVGE